jgi:hypothetical protein
LISIVFKLYYCNCIKHNPFIKGGFQRFYTCFVCIIILYLKQTIKNMKKIIFFFALATGLASFQANAQVAKKAATPAVTAQTSETPDFKFVEEMHDFGKIAQGKPVTVEMTFTNIGEQPLIISAVEPACGCTVAKYTQTPVKKGQKGSIILTYNASAPGVFTKATTIKSNAKTPVKVIYFKGEVNATPTAPASTAPGTSK